MAAPLNKVQTAPDDPAAVFAFETLRKRSDFLAAARGRKVPTPGFMLQIRDRKDDGPIRVGFTCSKKVGNAVARNRAKRRLRELARLVLPLAGRPGHDYVLIGRPAKTANRNFAQMQSELREALERTRE